MGKNLPRSRNNPVSNKPAARQRGGLLHSLIKKGDNRGERSAGMEDVKRTPVDVVGHDPALLAYWKEIPPVAQLRLLDSAITVSTLGELKKLAEELK